MNKNEKRLFKKKKIIWIVIILIIFISAIILYIKTDILKTKEQLFWKYILSEKDKVTQILSNYDIKTYSNYLKNSYYIKEGGISISSKYGFIKPINIQISKKGNNIEKITNTDIQLKYDNENMQNLLLVKDKDYFIIKNDYLTSDNYIGFENKNLKLIAQKFGIENTDYIPNKIKEIDYFELFSITNKEKNHILKEYVPVFRKIIKNENYKQVINSNKDDKKSQIRLYKVDISEEEAKELIIAILEKLYNDETSLKFISKKIKLLNNESEYCDINNIREKIKEMITYFESKEAKEKEFISIIIYKEGKNIVKTELVLKNNRTISIQTNDIQNKITIKQSDVKNKTVEFEGINNIANTVLDSITEITYSRNIINSEDKVDLNITCDFGIEKINFNYNYVEQIKNNVENILDRNNIEYVDVEKLNKEFYKKIIEKVHEISTLQIGKKY